VTSAPVVTADTLSPTIPVFPLSGALLLPRGELPLHIFEPRYRDMVRDSASAHGLIGMIQPTKPELATERPELYRIGCVGRLSGLRETDDGRYHLTLIGLCRYMVVEELPMAHGYREVIANYENFLSDLDPSPPSGTNREDLLTALKNYLDARELETDWEQVDDIDEETLINALAMMCPFDPREKQALLEAPGLAQRSEALIALFKMGGVAVGEDGPVYLQ
jgi:Lon protease-like protein